MEKALSGKVALVTGANSGIGESTAKLFAERGASVAVVARSIEGGERVVGEIRAAGGIAHHIPADMESREAVSAMVSDTVKMFGRLDFAFNNAGMVGEMAPIGQQQDENWDRVIATNLTAVFLAMRAEINQMLTQGGGVIVNNASGAGVMPQASLSPYCAAKHGILGLTKTAAREYAVKGIRVNAVCPGLIRTPQLERTFVENQDAFDKMVAGMPMKRIGEPEDIARAVLFLCAEGNFISGESLFVDGALACH